MPRYPMMAGAILLALAAPLGAMAASPAIVVLIADVETGQPMGRPPAAARRRGRALAPPLNFAISS